MPIYEYDCQSCNSMFELLVRNQQTPTCPECQSDELTKRLSVTAAPTIANGSLPICDRPTIPQGGCGLPQCGSGGCGSQ